MLHCSQIQKREAEAYYALELAEADFERSKSDVNRRWFTGCLVTKQAGVKVLEARRELAEACDTIGARADRFCE